MVATSSTVTSEPFQHWKQRELFDSSGRAARESRNESFKRVSGRQSQRRLAILEALEAAGRNGLTRFELAQKLGVQQSSVCNAVLQAIFAGEIVETTARRESRAGGAGLVLIHAKYRDGSEGQS